MLVAYDASESIVAISSSLTRFEVICNLPCKTCSASDPSDCLSCYASPIELSYTKLFTNASSGKGSCVDHCPQKYYHDTSSSSTCLSCDANCLTCSEDDFDLCLTCPTNHYLHDTVDQKCYASCPPGFYSTSTFHCRPCASNCASCTSLSVCVTCAESFYMHVGYNQCLDQCPPKTYILITPLRCVDCVDSNCLYCNQINCLACL